MGAERRRGPAPLAPAVLAVGLCLAAGPARAQGFYGTLTAQYQSTDQGYRQLQPDGTFRNLRQSRQYWLQNYEVNYASLFGEQLQMLAQLSLRNLSYVGMTQKEQVPYGSLRLVHPRYGLVSSYRPISTKGTVTLGGVGSPADTARVVREVSSHRREASVFAYVAPEGLPRLDVTWVRRSLDGDLSSGKDVGHDRSARMSWERGPLSLRGGYGGTRRELAGGASSSEQRFLDAGGTFRLLSSAQRSLTAEYQYGWNEFRRPGARNDGARTHAATVNGMLRPTPRSSWNLFYSYHRSELRAFQSTDLDNHDGSLLYYYTPKPALQLAGGGGLRTAYVGQSSDLFYYTTAIATATGRVRQGWTGIAGFTHTTNWDPGKKVFHVENLRLGSSWRLARGLSFNADVQASATGDTAARAARNVLQPSVGLSATPLPWIGVDYSWRVYRAGSRWVRPESRAVSDRLDLRWRPFVSLEVTGSLSHTGQLPGNDPQATMKGAGLRWSPSSRFQITGNYVESTQSRSFYATDFLSGQELFYGRVQAALSPRLTLNAGYSLSDRGRPSEATQIDASASWTFGR